MVTISKSYIDNNVSNSIISNYRSSNYDLFLTNRLKVKKVIHNNPATIVIFSDGSKEVVKVHKDDKYDKDIGVLLCIAKRQLGKDFHKALKEFTTLYD